jgi:DNA-directed RNA polymerase specialized sigma24 family protein
MSQRGSNGAADPAGQEGFVPTHWSVVLAAGGDHSAERQAAMQSLCQAYWYPLYTYIRRRGHDSAAAADFTQDFFSRFIEKNFLDGVSPAKGRFRSYLLACVNHFLANERDRAAAAKRGGGRAMISIDVRDAEGRYTAEPCHALTPQKLFDRRWAGALLEGVLAALRKEYEDAGKAELFDVLKKFLAGGDEGAGPQRDAAEAAGLTPGAMKAAVHRLRKRYKALLREHVAMTLDDPADIDDEIRDLFEALAAP